MDLLCGTANTLLKSLGCSGSGSSESTRSSRFADSSASELSNHETGHAHEELHHRSVGKTQHTRHDLQSRRQLS